MPSSVELQIGRVDFYDMPIFNKTETQMMISYLTKAHRYKMDSLGIVKRAVIDDNFGGFGGEAFASNGWRTFPGMVGKNNIWQIDQITSMDDSSFQWAYGCGAGSYTSAGGIGNTVDFTNYNVNGIFVPMFGSYFGDWEAQNNFLRAPLCADVPALATWWAGRPNWFVQDMALGEHIGYSAKLTQNNNTLYVTNSSNTPNFGARYVHIALMGDPSLRTDYVKPPKNLTVTQVDDTSSFLNWVGSPDTTVIGYYVYRASSRYGYFQKVSPLLTNHNFSDHGLPSGTYFYQVRAVKPTMTYSGGYYNLSIGSLSDSLILDNNLSVAELFRDESITVYPNPAKDKITIRIDYTGNDIATVSVIDITGREHYTTNKSLSIGRNEFSIDVHALPAGVYAVLVQTQSGLVTRKWMKLD